MAEEDKLTTLYNWSDQMTSAGAEVGTKHEELYKSIIEEIKTSQDDKVKKLAAQLIARFFKYFSSHEDAAFDSILDLCESEDVDMRKYATMAMITICKDCKHFVSKATDILIQLYQTTHLSEVNLINQSLMTLLNLDIKKFLDSFFLNFDDGAEIVRERALKFLSSKIHTIAEASLTRELEETLMNHSKKAMEDVTKDEFLSFMNILTKLKITKTATGQALLVSVIKSQAELDREIDVTDQDLLDKFLLCTRHTIPLLSQYNPSSDYVNYICQKILPQLSVLEKSGHDLRVLQALAEMSPHIHITEESEPKIELDKCQQIVFDKLIEHLPLPQEQIDAPVTEVSDKADSKAEDKPDQVKSDSNADLESKETPAGGDSKVDATKTAETADKESEPKKESVDNTDIVKSSANSPANLKFTHIEYLIYTFHQFGRLRPEFFSEALQNEIRLRLQHLALSCTNSLQLLSVVKPGEDLKKEESQIRSVALRTTKNISILVKDLFKKPPQFKNTVLLSCKPLASPRDSNLDKTNNNNNNGNNANKNNISSNNNNNNSYHKTNYNSNNRGQNNYKYNSNGGANQNRQAGQKYKYRSSYNNNQSDTRKRQRFANK